MFCTGTDDCKLNKCGHHGQHSHHGASCQIACEASETGAPSSCRQAIIYPKTQKPVSAPSGIRECPNAETCDAAFCDHLKPHDLQEDCKVECNVLDRGVTCREAGVFPKTLDPPLKAQDPPPVPEDLKPFACPKAEECNIPFCTHSSNHEYEASCGIPCGAVKGALSCLEAKAPVPETFSCLDAESCTSPHCSHREPHEPREVCGLTCSVVTETGVVCGPTKTTPGGLKARMFRSLFRGEGV